MRKTILAFTRLVIASFSFIFLPAFQKSSQTRVHIDLSQDALSYSSDVLDKWMMMQIRLMSNTTASFNGPFVRVYSYSGLAAYAAIVPGLSKNGYEWFSAVPLKLMPDILTLEKDKKYHWPSSVNAAMAYMNKSMFPFTNISNKIAIDSLEQAIETGFGKKTDAATIERSSAFGKRMAQRVFEWSETDGYRHADDPFIAPTGPGKWEPTPPSFSKLVTPYWGNLRTIVPGSTENSQPPFPVPYSEDSASAFYSEVNKVYTISQNLTPKQKAIVLFWKDINPGISAPGHWLNILRQVIQEEKTPLEKAAYVYALTGMSLNDAWISCWKTRYIHNLLRHVTYVRKVMRHSDWLPALPTPPHPEYSSGFAALAGAVSEVLTVQFGNRYKITDHTYDYLGMASRTYSSFYEMAKEAADSKMYGGIHYQFSVDAGLQQGRQVAQNIETILLQKNKAPESGN